MGRRIFSAWIAVVVVALTVTSARALPLTWSGGRPESEAVGESGSISIAAVANFGYQPETISNVPLHANITVTFTDDDVLPHTFNISSREGFEIPNNYSATQLNQLFSEYHALYAATVNYEGEISVGNFTSPSSPGWYEFICNESGHFSEGMYGFIAFGEPVPSNLTLPHSGSETPITGSTRGIIVGVAVTVVVLAGIFVWFRRRSTFRPPPSPPGQS